MSIDSLTLKFLLACVLTTACAVAQSAIGSVPNGAPKNTASAVADDLPRAHNPATKPSLVRGVLRKLDPVYNQLLIRTFGGRDLRINFDLRTKFAPAKSGTPFHSIPPGSVLSVDTVINDGKLFALAVRTDTPKLSELNGQVVSFDPTRSQLTVRDAISPEEVSLRIDSNTSIVERGQPVAALALSSGMLVRIWFSAGNDSAHDVEIVAKPGSSFTFEGQVIALDLRLHTVSLSSNTDHTLRELVFAALDTNSLNLLREGNDVVIQAEFDGQQYNIRSVTSLAHAR